MEYILTQRPPSIGTHPVEGLESVEAIRFRNRSCHLLKYNRKLTHEEVKRYELTVNMKPSDLVFKEVVYISVFGKERRETIVLVEDNIVTTEMENGRRRKYSFLEFQTDYPELFFNSHK